MSRRGLLYWFEFPDALDVLNKQNDQEFSHKMNDSIQLFEMLLKNELQSEHAAHS